MTFNGCSTFGESKGDFLSHVIAREQVTLRPWQSSRFFDDLTLSERSDPSPENLTFALLKSIFCPLPTVEGKAVPSKLQSCLAAKLPKSLNHYYKRILPISMLKFNHDNILRGFHTLLL